MKQINQQLHCIVLLCTMYIVAKHILYALNIHILITEYEYDIKSQEKLKNGFASRFSEEKQLKSIIE